MLLPHHDPTDGRDGHWNRSPRTQKARGSGTRTSNKDIAATTKSAPRFRVWDRHSFLASQKKKQSGSCSATHHQDVLHRGEQHQRISRQSRRPQYRASPPAFLEQSCWEQRERTETISQPIPENKTGGAGSPSQFPPAPWISDIGASHSLIGIQGRAKTPQRPTRRYGFWMTFVISINSCLQLVKRFFSSNSLTKNQGLPSELADGKVRQEKML